MKRYFILYYTGIGAFIGLLQSGHQVETIQGVRAASFFNAIYNALQDAFNWFWDQVAAFGQTCFAGILAALPTGWSDYINANAGTFYSYFSAANQWVPLDLAFALFAAFMVFFSLFYATKVIVRLF